MSIVYPGTGNGINGSRADVTYYTSSEWSTNASIANLTSDVSSKCGSGLGVGVTLTFSANFGDGQSYYQAGYDSDGIAANATGVTLAQQTAIVNVMSAWSAVANIGFSQIVDSSTQAGDLRWSNTDGDVSTAFGYYPSTSTYAGDMWFGPYYSDLQNPVVGEYGYLTFLHELGHALGLNHPHDADFSTPAVNGEDQLKYSVMSYRDYAGDELDGYETSAYPTTPMLNDIAAMQWLYGAAVGVNAGNDTYSWAAGKVVYETIWDGGGNDTISAATQTMGCVLNLNSGQWSQIGALFNNGQADVRDCLTIAYGAVIENATGSNFNDTLIGNTAANTLIGAGGHDSLQGGGGNDVLSGGLGNDTLDGGSGIDLASYSSIGGAVTASLLTNTASDAGGFDTLISIENITGSAYNDNIVGNAGNNILTGLAGIDTLIGGAGNDTLVGGLGNDSLDGGAGTDTISYTTAKAAVTINLATNSVTGGEGVDTIANIESVLGTAFNDKIIGSSVFNVLTGAQGNDTLDGGAGNDSLLGGVGNDTYLFTRGYATDTITENDATAGNTDLVQFGVGVAAGQIWLSHVSNNLEVSIIGTVAKIVVKDWYLGAAHHVEQFKTTDGNKTLTDARVQNLVTAMAAWTPPPVGQTNLTAAQHTALDAVIAANWQ